MAESDQISRERRRLQSSSAHPITAQILTRSNCSGQTRSVMACARSSRDFTYLRHHLSSLKRKLPQSSHILSDLPSCTQIKDLRLRRVFCPASISDEEKRAYGEDKIEERGKGSCRDASSLNVRQDENKDGVDGLKVEGNGVKGNGSARHHNGHVDDCFDGEKVGEDGNKDNINGDLGEECLQTTPADMEILSSENGSSLVDFGSQSLYQKATQSQGSGTNPRSKSVLNRCSRVKLFKNPGSFSYRRLLPYLMDVAKDSSCNLLTGQSSKGEKPHGLDHPDLDLHGKEEHGNRDNPDLKDQMEDSKEPKVYEDQDAEVKHVLSCADHVFSKSSTESCHRSKASPENRRIEFSPKRKLVQDPFSRRKLFRTPGSVNYRRLLPFFMDIPVDNPCASENGHSTELDKSIIEEKTLSPLLVSGREGTGEENSDGNNYAAMCFDNGPPAELVTLDNPRDTCSNNDPEPQPPEHLSEAPALSDSDKEEKTEVKHAILYTENNLEISDGVLVLRDESPEFSKDVATCVSDQLFVDSAGECMKSNEETANNTEQTEANSSKLKKLQVNAEAANNAKQSEANSSKLKKSQVNAETANNAEQSEAVSFCLKTPQLEASVSWRNSPAGSPPKGILRRNPRGCRGPCFCLNCSSFRLHAEKAFEFSRNQMQDAEEIVLDLVGEVSYLRDMLEKSASADHTSFRASQVKEACRKASGVAELARGRLQEMNCDLQVHCRIPSEERARVKFAHYVQEKVIPRADEPNEINECLLEVP